MIRYTSSKTIKAILINYLQAFCYASAMRYDEVKLDTLYLHEAPLYFKMCESSQLEYVMNPMQEFHLYMDTIKEDFLFKWKKHHIKAWFFSVDFTHFMLYQPESDKAYYELYFVLPKDEQDIDNDEQKNMLNLLLQCIEAHIQGKF